jgi:hypothetical protein
MGFGLCALDPFEAASAVSSGPVRNGTDPCQNSSGPARAGALRTSTCRPRRSQHSAGRAYRAVRGREFWIRDGQDAVLAVRILVVWVSGNAGGIPSMSWRSSHAFQLPGGLEVSIVPGRRATSASKAASQRAKSGSMRTAVVSAAAAANVCRRGPRRAQAPGSGRGLPLAQRQSDGRLLPQRATGRLLWWWSGLPGSYGRSNARPGMRRKGVQGGGCVHGGRARPDR